MPARKNTSRSKELDVVKNIMPEKLAELKKYCREHPDGGTFETSDVRFRYGKIGRLLADHDWTLRKIDLSGFGKITEVYHLDGLDKKAKAALEAQLKLEEGTLSLKAKSDLLLVNARRTAFIISYKDKKGKPKLGQRSEAIKFGGAELGNTKVPVPGFLTELDAGAIKCSDTALSQEQFDKLTASDRKYSYWKNNFPKEWDLYVQARMNEAREQLNGLKTELTRNRVAFKEFILTALLGRKSIIRNFFILTDEELISIDELERKAETLNYTIEVLDDSTANKPAIMIHVILKGRRYGITRIEPAFDGARKNVSQTKGIIFYYQYCEEVDPETGTKRNFLSFLIELLRG